MTDTDHLAAPGVPVLAEPVVPPAGRSRETLHFALRNKKVVGAVVVILGFLVLGLVAPLFTNHGPNEYVGPPAAPPSTEYWFGTTTFGQDVFLQFANGIRSTFVVGLLGGGLAALIGMTVGFVAGYRGGLVDELLNMLTNIVLVLPALAVLIILHAYVGVTSVPMQALFIGLFSWPWVARAVRAQTFSLRSREFVDLARLSGMRPLAVIRREIAPNMSSYLFMTFILLFGGSVLMAATLDFIGLGPTDAISLGLMMNSAVHWSALHLGLWWWFVPPGAAITAIVGALYVMNVGLDEVFNPKLREM
ncbi:peptide ABC transporter permease [Asanoa ishikariensis]|uniref:Peptide/nickel transport system permease protein n=1 Tax=Asanoa ishikariensis TaxID=137265 RepID=A0A1H3RGL4_9ACTN|nr:ABC transporter permease [Asanoa ishikariensis]GIF67226.1 peptide ABC transporter permease [Asanoa ishikariensis]SDZ24874.1 peptide/nickel transport system permease protein [Asanoa ishikariensis]